METKHSPGPWEWSLYDEFGADLLAADGEVVLNDGMALGEYDRVIDPAGPNGRLVRAAPDLLAACEAAQLAIRQLVMSDTHVGDTHARGALDLAERAETALTDTIQKARGE